MREEYKKLAKYYDSLYKSKNYNEESQFIVKLFKKYNIRSVLDIGCGTGSHIAKLEKEGFECTGIDLNQEMLDIARQKVKAPLYQANMINFDLGLKYDAIICMFATFNYLLTDESAIKTLSCFYKHLNSKGIVLIDLHNLQNRGSKTDKIKDIERIMKWSYDKASRMEKTKIKFIVPEGIIEDEHTMRIYSIEEMERLLKNTGFKKFNCYGNYELKPAKESSKNLEIIGIKE